MVGEIEELQIENVDVKVKVERRVGAEFWGVVFHCPHCGVLLAGERSGNTKRPSCETGLNIIEETDLGTAVLHIVEMRRPLREFIRF